MTVFLQEGGGLMVDQQAATLHPRRELVANLPLPRRRPRSRNVGGIAELKWAAGYVGLLGAAASGMVAALDRWESGVSSR